MHTESIVKPWKLVLTLIACAALIAGGTGIAGLLYANRVEPPRKEELPLTLMVDTVIARPDTVREQFLGYGTVLADRRAQRAAEVRSTVLERVAGIRAGSAVTEGQLLLRLDDREYRQELARVRELATADEAAIAELEVQAGKLDELIRTARQELRVAESEKRRLTGLFEKGMAAETEYNLADLAYQQARRVLQEYELEAAKLGPRREQLNASRRGHVAAAKLAELNVERCRIRAPFTGRIERLAVNEGDTVLPGAPLLTLIDTSVVEVPVQLAASQYERVEVGAACRLERESLVDTVWHGTVARIAPSVDPNARMFAVYVRVDNAEQAEQLVPGTFVRAVVAGRTLSDQVLVPRSAVRENHVFVARDGVARRRAVEVGPLVHDRVLIADGLRAGDQIILSNLAELSDGMPVRTREVPREDGAVP